MRYKEIITERYFNAFKMKDKAKYAQEIWDMLQRSYAEIGGIAGSGFNNIEDMVKSNHMFKVALKGGKPVAVVIYKNKGGARKKVALGTDGTPEGIAAAKDSLAAEFNTGRAYGEVSGPAWGTIKKLIPPEVLKTFLIPVDKVAAVIKKEIIPGAGEDMRTSDNDPYTEFYYQRMIGGEMHTKVAYGNPSTNARFDS